MFKAIKKFVHRLWYPTPAITPAEQQEFDTARRLQQEIATLQATINDLKATHEFSDLMTQATAFGLPTPTKEDKKAFVLTNTGETLEESNNTLVKKMVDVKKNGDELGRFLDITSTITTLNLEAKKRAEKGGLVKWDPESVMNKMTFDSQGRAEHKVYLEVDETFDANTVHDFLPAGFNKVASTEVSGINVADIGNPVDSDPVKETEEDKSIDIIEVRDPLEILEKAKKAREAYYESVGRASEGSSYASHLSKALKDGSLSGRGAVFDGSDLAYWTPENEAEANLRKKLADKLDQDARRIKQEMELENAKWNWVEYGTYSHLDPSNPPGLDQYVRTHPSKARNLEQVHPETGLYVPFDERQKNVQQEVPLDQQNPHPASQVWAEKTDGELKFTKDREEHLKKTGR